MQPILLRDESVDGMAGLAWLVYFWMGDPSSSFVRVVMPEPLCSVRLTSF